MKYILSYVVWNRHRNIRMQVLLFITRIRDRSWSKLVISSLHIQAMELKLPLCCDPDIYGQNPVAISLPSNEFIFNFQHFSRSLEWYQRPGFYLTLISFGDHSLVLRLDVGYVQTQIQLTSEGLSICVPKLWIIWFHSGYLASFSMQCL